MCVVSSMGDYYDQKWKQQPYDQLIRQIEQTQPKISPLTQGASTITWPSPGVSQLEFNALKKEVLEMKEILKVAVDYDKKNNQPHCEIEDKIATLKKVAELLGVDLSDILK
jgi:hypothetical protein